LRTPRIRTDPPSDFMPCSCSESRFAIDSRFTLAFRLVPTKLTKIYRFSNPTQILRHQFPRSPTTQILSDRSPITQKVISIAQKTLKQFKRSQITHRKLMTLLFQLFNYFCDEYITSQLIRIQRSTFSRW
jgi:hypothetical protein